MTVEHYQQSIDEIQTILMSQGDPDEVVIERLHGRLTKAINEVNQRLRGCEDLLRKGFRGEAIRDCEIAPNLLDAVAVLDFPEVTFWSDYAEQFNLPAVPMLAFDLAAEMNDAYATEQSLEKILNQYRAHVLARSPLPARIHVLRIIAKRDPDNPIWDEDLRSFERARHNELQSEVQAAIRAGDGAELAELESELQDASWREPPSKKLIAQTRAAHTEFRAKQARAELDALQPKLTAAFSELDVDAGRRYRSRWNGLVAMADLDLNDPLQDLVAPALDWLRQEDRLAEEEADFNADVAQLDAAIDRGADGVTLDRLANNVVRSERDMPPRVRRRYEERIRQLDRQASRKRTLIISSIAISVLVLGAVTAFVIRGKMYDARLASTESQLAGLIENGRLDEAQEKLDDLREDDPKLYEEEAIQSLKTKLDAAVASETTRKSRRRVLLDESELAGVAGSKWSEALSKLAAAEKASQGDSELTEVRELRRKVLQRQTAQQRTIDDAYRAAVGKLVERTTNMRSDDPTVEIATIDGILNEARRLKNPANVSEETKNSADIDKLIARLTSRRGFLESLLAVNTELRKITTHVGDRHEFAQALKAYEKKRGLATRSQDFQVVLKNSPNWAAFERFSSLAGDWSNRDFTKLDAKQARAALVEANTLKKIAVKLDALKRLDPVLDYLNSVALRESATGKKLLQPIRAVLNDGQLGLHMLKTKAGTRYYFVAGALPKKVGTNWQVKYLSDLQLKTIEPVLGGVKNAMVANTPRAIGGFDWESPQLKFRKAALADLENFDKAGWESTFAMMYGRLMAAEIDPILKLQVLQQLIAVGAQGSSAFGDATAPIKKRIAAGNIDTTVTWIDPKDAAAERERERAAKMFLKFPSVKAFTADVAKRTKLLVKPNLGPRPRWVAWLHKDLEGRKWVCSVKEQRLNINTMNGTLSILATDSNGVVSLKPIGTVNRGSLKLNAFTRSQWKEGKPVYFSQTVGGKGKG